jgi:hypothetical protein
MDFSPEMLDLQQRTRRFIQDRIIPMEQDLRQGPHGPAETLRDDLIARGLSVNRRQIPVQDCLHMNRLDLKRRVPVITSGATGEVATEPRW